MVTGTSNSVYVPGTILSTSMHHLIYAYNSQEVDYYCHLHLADEEIGSGNLNTLPSG